MLMNQSQAVARLAYYETLAREDDFDRHCVEYGPRVTLQVFHDEGDFAYLLCETWVEKSTAVKTIMTFEDIPR